MAETAQQIVYPVLMKIGAEQMRCFAEMMTALAELMRACALKMRDCAAETRSRSPTNETADAEMIALADEMSAFADELIASSDEMIFTGDEMIACSMEMWPSMARIAEKVPAFTRLFHVFVNKGRDSYAKMGAFAEKMKACFPYMNAPSASVLKALVNVICQRFPPLQD